MPNPYLSVVAPCMNEEQGLEEFYSRTSKAINEVQVAHYEIILIDDGSTDGTWDVIKSLHLKDKHVKGLRLSRNFGHQAALSAGLQEAKGEFIFIIDSDLQDPPEILGQMMVKLNSGFDVVYGQRNRRYGETVFKKSSASVFYRVLALLADIDIPRDTGDFRLINRKVLEAYNRLSESYRFTRGLIAWLGFKQTPLMYDRHPRYAGSTKYPLLKMISFSVDAITGFSLKPLRLIIFLGILTSIISVFALFYTIYGWLFLNTVPGWTSIMVAILLISSVQLVSIGVVGEYVGRTLMEAKKRPLFFIQERAEGK